MKLRAQLLVRQFGGRLPTACQLPEGYVLEFVSPDETCPHCCHALRRVRTSRHQPVGLMLGRPRVRRVQKACVHCGWTDSLDGYQQLVPPGGNYAFDLMVEVGLARLRGLQQETEVRDRLQQRWGLTLPLSAIGLLTDSFLDGLAAAHQAHGPALRARLEQDGGYAMHVDGTCEPGTDVVFAAFAAPRSWTLEAAKMTTENVTEISQLLRRCVEDFGPPLAVMRDLSKNIQAAKDVVIPDAVDLICHYHFLENVGTKLCEKPHTKLTHALRRLRTRSALAILRKEMVRWNRRGNSPVSRQGMEELLSHPEQVKDLDLLTSRRLVAYVLLRWLDDYVADLHGEYFPFDLPSLAFYRRGRQLGQWLKTLLAAKNFPCQDFSTLVTMARHLSALEEDAAVVAAAERLEQASALFEELRQVLRLDSSPEHLLRSRGPSETREEIEHIPERLKGWRETLQGRMSDESDVDQRRDQKAVLDYLKTYERQLVGHVIPLEGHAEPLVVSRTNNLSEHRFGSTKRALRRKVGTKKLTRYIQAMRPEVLLLPNLDDAAYLDIVFDGSLDNMAATFSEHWPLARAIRHERQQAKTGHPMPTTKKQLRRPSLLETVKQLVLAAIEQHQAKQVA